MTDKEFEDAYNEAFREFAENPNAETNIARSRYFFRAGTAFGVALTKAIYDEIYNKVDSDAQEVSSEQN